MERTMRGIGKTIMGLLILGALVLTFFFPYFAPLVIVAILWRIKILGLASIEQ